MDPRRRASLPSGPLVGASHLSTALRHASRRVGFVVLVGVLDERVNTVTIPDALRIPGASKEPRAAVQSPKGI